MLAPLFIYMVHDKKRFVILQYVFIAIFANQLTVKLFHQKEINYLLGSLNRKQLLHGNNIVHLRLSVHDEVAINWHVHRRSLKWKLTNFKVDKNNIFYRISGHLV